MSGINRQPTEAEVRAMIARTYARIAARHCGANIAPPVNDNGENAA